MSEKKEPGGVYTAGYHGTSVEQAMRIVETGFDTTAGAAVFSPECDMWTAAHRAICMSVGQPEFALIQAEFPPTVLEYDLEHYALVLAPELLDDVRVIRVMAWQMRRNSGMPPRQLYPEESSVLREWWRN